MGEPRADAPVPRSGQDFPVSSWERYELLELLGRGGMGEVYEARDRRLGRLVALKFIRGADPDRVMRFLQEARAQARIDHPNVCKVFEVGEVSGKAYIAMQLVGGQRLDQAAATMTLPEKMEAMREVAAAIHEAHRLGIIHRDLKPSNIMLERREDGRCVPVVMDFGLAYEAQSGHDLTETGALLGTPAYMAPEQARGDVRSIDRRSDVYSLGATLYELITGEAPFSDATPVGTLAKVLNEEPRPFRARVPHVSTDLETIVLKCLSKEPDQRYPSARALAEDLARCIDGEPILGRPPSLTYRLRRRARKHRTLVAVSAASLASILVLATFGVRSWLEARYTRQQSAERVRLAEQLGQQVKEIEWFLRTSNALPLHDTTREQQLVRERMARIAAQRHDLGANGEGLVHYALGRGHLAMHEFGQAHAELGLAREKGVDSRELHYALGRVLGELYHQALKDARRGGDKAWVARRQRALEKQYLEPARQSLERSRGLELESPLYLEGLIAFFRGEYDAAARIAEQVATRDPWMYEARKLAGDAAYARAMEQLERGEYDQARAGLRTAALLFERAAEAARSDAWCYEALAEAWLQQAEVDKRQGKSRKESLESALAASDKGLQAAPLRSSGHTKKAYVLMNWYRLMRFEGGGQDPKPILDAWTTTAARAVELDPKDVHAHDTLGYSYFMRGYQDARDGRDPMPAWDQASSWLTRAIQLDPHYAWGLNELGLLNRWRGNYQREHGQDPRPAYAEAVRYFSESAKSDPTYLLARSNLVDVYGAMANYDLSRGLDPGPAVLKAREAGEQALAIDNNFYSALNHVALAELTRARFLVDTGADPRPSLERALRHLDSSLKINPKAARTWFHRATGHLLEAHLAVRENRDPGAAAAAGQQALAEATRIDAGCADCRILSARLALAEADWARRQGQAALPQLRRALAEGRRAVALYPYYESHQELARACWKLAQALPPGEAAATVTEGLTHVERALKFDANLAQAHAIRGGLLLLRARAVREAAARLDTTQQARAAFARALELNPLLRRELEDVSRELEVLTGPAGQGRR
ncbi:MAG TPA: protein kinase [Longimicrobium sp.]|nr:protein kinase [Longimicrobium sp.]